MCNALAGFRKVKFVAFDFVRWPDEQFKIFRHLTLYSYSQIDEHTFFNGAGIKIFSEFIPSNICINNQEVFIVTVYRCAE